MRNRFEASHYSNKQMNPNTYKMRRDVMAYIYEAKKLDPSMPRVDVRITEDHREALATARMSDKIIWVSERAVKSGKFDLRTIVFHELLHAVYGVKHDSLCPLMKPIHTPLTRALVHKNFKKHLEVA